MYVKACDEYIIPFSANIPEHVFQIIFFETSAHAMPKRTKYAAANYIYINKETTGTCTMKESPAGKRAVAAGSMSQSTKDCHPRELRLHGKII